MKLDELKPKLGRGEGIDLRKVKLVSKALVAPAKGTSYPMPLVGVTIDQTQSTGDTSRVGGGYKST